jgi:hypothetical protein
MSASPGTPQEHLSKEPGRDAHCGQRFGRVASRHPSASRHGGHADSYLVCDEQTGVSYSFSYADIVTEGFRAIRTGERVRFLIDRAHPGHASYIIRLDLPDIEKYYQ